MRTILFTLVCVTLIIITVDPLNMEVRGANPPIQLNVMLSFKIYFKMNILVSPLGSFPLFQCSWHLAPASVLEFAAFGWWKMHLHLPEILQVCLSGTFTVLQHGATVLGHSYALNGRLASSVYPHSSHKNFCYNILLMLGSTLNNDLLLCLVMISLDVSWSRLSDQT